MSSATQSPIRDIWLLRPDNPNLHAGRKVAVVATDGVEEIELNTVLHYFRSRGAQVDLIAPKRPSYPDFLGLQIPAVRETHIMTITFIATAGWIRFDRYLEDASAKDYDVVIVPGGVWNPDTLRADRPFAGRAGRNFELVPAGRTTVRSARSRRIHSLATWARTGSSRGAHRSPSNSPSFEHRRDSTFLRTTYCAGFGYDLVMRNKSACRLRARMESRPPIFSLTARGFEEATLPLPR